MTLLGLISHYFFVKWAKPGLFLFIFDSLDDKYITNLIINDIRVEGLPWTQTWGGRMVGADVSTELWWHPVQIILVIINHAIIRKTMFLLILGLNFLRGLWSNWGVGTAQIEMQEPNWLARFASCMSHKTFPLHIFLRCRKCRLG